MMFKNVLAPRAWPDAPNCAQSLAGPFLSALALEVEPLGRVRPDEALHFGGRRLGRGSQLVRARPPPELDGWSDPEFVIEVRDAPDEKRQNWGAGHRGQPKRPLRNPERRTEHVHLDGSGAARNAVELCRRNAPALQVPEQRQRIERVDADMRHA